MKLKKFFIYPISVITLATPMIAASCQENDNSKTENTTNQNDAENTAITQLQQELNSKITAINQYQNDIATLKNEIAELKKQNNSNKSQQVIDLERQLSEKTAKITQLVSDINLKDSKIAEINKLTQKLQKEIEELKKRKNENNNGSTSNGNQNNPQSDSADQQKDNRIAELEQSVNEKNNQLQELQKTLTEIQNKVTQLTNSNQQLTNKDTQNQSTISELRRKIDELNRTISSKDNEISSVKQQTSQLQSQVSELQKEIEKLKKQNQQNSSYGSNTNPSGTTSSQNNSHVSEERPTDPSKQIKNMFNFTSDTITVNKGDSNFNLTNLYQIDPTYEAVQKTNKMNEYNVMTVKGIDLPPFPGYNKVLKKGPSIFDEDETPPTEQWFDSQGRNFFMLGDNGNWFDSNKWYLPDDYGRTKEREFGNGGGDARCCWAAAASNTMLWWIQQNRKYIEAYYKAHPEDIKLMLNGKNILQSYNPKDYAFILNFLVQYFNNQSGYSIFGSKWLLSGVKDNRFDNPIKSDMQQDAINFKGFFPKVFNEANVESLVSYRKIAGGVTDVKHVLSDYIKEAFAANDAVTFAIQPRDRYNHAVTLWGAEFDSDGIVQYIYYSDSDEVNRANVRREKIQRMKVLYSDDNRTASIVGDVQLKDGLANNLKYSWTILSLERLSLGQNIWKSWYEKEIGKDDQVTVNLINDDTFDINKKGTYNIKYQATDKFNNTQTKVLKVNVK
ncbi:IdeS/Mac family cysteine endopeptidase [Mycoplasma buteonis]|uniref:IdeS/Mac family cysteine endopeptidase n=1 Tax=Mycoplasma buteonis TaxID=171280 RepID=UPI00056A2921|nr:IdeS/Mac family cysteine endopeptidase [Mycoplasma buteonis]